MRSEFLGEFLKVAEHYSELVHDITDARHIEISGNGFAGDSRGHEQEDVCDRCLVEHEAESH